MGIRLWRLLENNKDYEAAVQHFEKINDAPKGSPEYKEMILLAVLINHYEKKGWGIHDVDPVEMIKIRAEDFG